MEDDQLFDGLEIEHPAGVPRDEQVSPRLSGPPGPSGPPGLPPFGSEEYIALATGDTDRVLRDNLPDGPVTATAQQVQAIKAIIAEHVTEVVRAVLHDARAVMGQMVHRSHYDALRAEMLKRRNPTANHDADDVGSSVSQSGGGSSAGGSSGGQGNGQDGAATGAAACFSPMQQANAQRKPAFGFATADWTKCTWRESTTRAALETYRVNVVNKLHGAEQATMQVVLDEVAKVMDGWEGRNPTKEDVEQVTPMVRRLYARHRGLLAPKGTSGAIAVAIERAGEEERMDPTFRAAAEAANKLEMLALAGGYGSAAAAGVKGSLAMFRGFRGGRGGRGGPGGDRGQGRVGPQQYNKHVRCWGCGNEGHPQRLCPRRGGGGGGTDDADGGEGAAGGGKRGKK